MATSTWSTEAWTDTQQSAGGATDLSKILWQADWSDLADGTSLNGSTGEAYGVDLAAKSYVSSEQTLAGRKSAKEVLGPFSSDYWPLGFQHGISSSSIPANDDGAEIWFRVWVYHVSGYTWETDIGHRKTMRFAEYEPSGTNTNGYNNFQYVWPDQLYSWQPGSFVFIKSFVNEYKPLDRTGNYAFQTGVWECIECYSKSGASDSTGQIKMWKDGVLLDTVNCQTTDVAANRLAQPMFISNWNKGLTKEVTHYYCAPAVAVRNRVRDDTGSMATDSQGFPYIGTAT